MLRLGRFWFKNDEVILLSGAARDISLLADRLAEASKAGVARLSLNELSEVSQRHPATLYAVQYPEGSLEQLTYLWPCLRSAENLGVVRQLKELAEKEQGERIFALPRTGGYLTIDCGGYDAEWWSKR